MSTLTYLTTLVQQAISRLNNYEANAKKVDELPHQTTLEPTSKIPVSRAGNSEHLTVQQIISSIQNSNYNQLLAVGTITVDGTDIIIPSGVSGQINGALYGTSTDTTIPIVLCEAGFNRKDILVLTTSNTVVVISGEETDGAIVLAPPTPPDTVYITEFDVNDTAIGTPGDPVLGAQFKKKIENTRYKSTLSGENVIIPFQAAGQSHYSVTHAALVSVAGFTTAGLTTPMYEGQDVIFENQTGHEITLKNSFGVETSFVIGADLIVPNKGKIWFRFRNNELELINKNWFKINEVVTAQNLGEFINSLDSKTNVKDTDEFVLSDSDDGLKSKKTRFLDIKNKLKGYFDTLYLSLSIFNDFQTAVFDSLDNKLDKSTAPSSVYATDAAGLQVMKPISEFQTDISGKLDKVTTSGVERVYTINPDGSQTTKPTSDFQDVLVSGTNIKTIDGASILGSGNLIVGSNKVEFHGVVRYLPLTNTWELLNDSNHKPKNITSVISTASTNGFGLALVNPGNTDYSIGTILITPDESLTRMGISAGASFAFGSAIVPVVQNQGFSFKMSGTTIVAETNAVAPQPFELSWDAVNLSLTIYFRAINQTAGEGLGICSFNFDVTPDSSANFFFVRTDPSYIPNNNKVKLKFYDITGTAVTPTGQWFFKRTQPWKPLNNQLGALGPNSNFWVYGYYIKKIE